MSSLRAARSRQETWEVGALIQSTENYRFLYTLRKHLSWLKMKRLFNDQHMVSICFANLYLSTSLSTCSATRKFNYIQQIFVETLLCACCAVVNCINTAKMEGRCLSTFLFRTFALHFSTNSWECFLYSRHWVQMGIMQNGLLESAAFGGIKC